MALVALINMKIHGQILYEVAHIFGLEFIFIGVLLNLEILVSLNFVGNLVDVKRLVAAKLL